jgi:uncharacterized protein
MKYMLLYHHYLEKYKDVMEFTHQCLKETAGSWPHDYHPWTLPEHRMEHTRLVLKNSLLLAVNRKVDLDVIALSAILHDVAFYSPERREHAGEGAKTAKKYLTEHGYPTELMEKVVHAIKVHAGPLVFSPGSMEAKILQDADTIDKVGALGITTFLLHHGSRKMMPKQAFEELKRDMPKRLRWYYRTMNTSQGKKIVGEGCRYIRTFVKKLQKEMS